jgi:hypothetical protein
MGNLPELVPYPLPAPPFLKHFVIAERAIPVVDDRVQACAQAVSCPVQSRHDSAKRSIHNGRHLAIAESLNVDEIQHLLEPQRQFSDCLDELTVRYCSQYRLLGGIGERRMALSGPGPLNLRRLGGEHDRLALTFPEVIDKGIQQNAVQPGSDIRVRREPAKSSASSGHRFLDEVLGVLPVPRHLESGPQQLVAMRECLALEPAGQFRAHPLAADLGQR